MPDFERPLCEHVCRVKPIVILNLPSGAFKALVQACICIDLLFTFPCVLHPPSSLDISSFEASEAPWAHSDVVQYCHVSRRRNDREHALSEAGRAACTYTAWVLGQKCLTVCFVVGFLEGLRFIRDHFPPCLLSQSGPVHGRAQHSSAETASFMPCRSGLVCVTACIALSIPHFGLLTDLFGGTCVRIIVAAGFVSCMLMEIGAGLGQTILAFVVPPFLLLRLNKSRAP